MTGPLIVGAALAVAAACREAARHAVDDITDAEEQTSDDDE